MLSSQDMFDVERSSDFSWDENPAARGVVGSPFARGLTSEEQSSSFWIYDHIPKAGGTEFSRLCETRLDPFDHLHVPWPGSWLGVTLGRAMRAKVIHGHGARFAAVVMPWRTAHVAVTLRDSVLLLVSYYQQVCRTLALTGEQAPSLEEWISLSAESQTVPGFISQLEWVASDFPPDLAFPHHAQTALPAHLHDRVALGVDRLDRYDLIAPTPRVEALFDEICARSGLPARPAEVGTGQLGNASEVPSGRLLEALPDRSVSLLGDLSEGDRLLYAAAERKAAWFVPELVTA